MDVYSNIGSLEPWWRLGNLRTDSLGEVIHRLENDGITALSLNKEIDMCNLMDLYGVNNSTLMYSSQDELLSKYFEELCEQEWNRLQCNIS